MTDIVETLRQRREVEYIGGYVHVIWEDKEALEAADEIERLRWALRYYSDEHPDVNEGPWGPSSTDFGETARLALEAKDE